MVASIAQIRARLHSRDFVALFVEDLGWDRLSTGQIALSVDGTQYDLRSLAQKRGAVVCVLDSIPDRATRSKIERALAKVHFEHVIVYSDQRAEDQVWQWAKRDPGKPVAVREYWLRQGQSGEPLAQRLAGLTVTLDEEEALTLTAVTARMRRSFDADRITRAFYDRFREEHRAFLDFIDGIATVGDREWYASLMLNRLMFTYFIQKKGFLDGDTDYLRNRLVATQAHRGPGEFLTFYRHFLRRLFHEGFGKHRLSPQPDLDDLIGRVPYLNGGLFEVHELERRYPAIEVPDDAFSRLFDFFDGYTWHLDERPLRADNEINPDVLGHIFEKYVNQKQMGAYYSKEDITEYISKSTVVPFLVDAARAECIVAFENPGGPTVWDLLSADPDRYIYSAVSHGEDQPLPVEISMGLAPSTLSAPVTDGSGLVQTLELRKDWNKLAPSTIALPAETWRDVVQRREHCKTVREQLAAGEVRGVDALIALNLDLRQFVQDVIHNCEGPDLLRALWHAVEQVSVLDPACGSGAFLFAALNILEPLYDACLHRMEAFVEDADSGSGHDGHPDGFSDFRKLLASVAEHPNRSYFVLKNIILNNLFGVDIMEEAVEICKLRLFLKLAAQVAPDPEHENLGIDPLPDIDFNIRAGNTLVGFATYEEVERAVTGKLDFENSMERISLRAAELQQAFDEFREEQVQGRDAATREHKVQVREQLGALHDELNRYLAADYGVDPHDSTGYARWLTTHQPFHWFVEFYGIMSNGGFDVVIGNPPYVEYTQVTDRYTILDPETRALGNLHGMMTQRSLNLLSPAGGMSMIVPVALASTDRFEGLRKELLAGRNAWVSHYDFRPAKLFEGAEQRLTIFILRPGPHSRLFSTRYNRWYASQRGSLFSCLRYTSAVDCPVLRSVWPKLDGDVSISLLKKVAFERTSVDSVLSQGGETRLYYKNTGILYFTNFTLEAPECFINGKKAPSSRETTLKMSGKPTQQTLHSVLNSSLFYLMYEIHSNCRDLNPTDIRVLRIPEGAIEDARLHALSEELHDDQQSKSEFRIRNQKLTGEVRLQNFFPAQSKAVIDKIDGEIASLYGLTEEELDFVTNYDIKYRLGADSESGSDVSV